MLFKWLEHHCVTIFECFLHSPTQWRAGGEITGGGQRVKIAPHISYNFPLKYKKYAEKGKGSEARRSISIFL